MTTQQYPDVSNVFERMEQRHTRQQLEHSLATAFCAMQRERDARKRQEYWFECLRLGSELEKLNEHD